MLKNLERALSYFKKIKAPFYLVAYEVAFVFLTACRTKDNTDDSLIQIKVSQEQIEQQNVNLSKIIAIREIIPLETSNLCIIGSIDKVIISENRILVLDRWRAKSIFIFDRSGRFITKIAGEGKGPTELLEPADVNFSRDFKKIMILDYQLRKVNIYNENGIFESSISIDFFGTHFEFLVDGKIVFAARGSYLLYVTDTCGKTLYKDFKLIPEFQMDLGKPLIKHGNDVFFQQYFDPQLYKVGLPKVQPFFKINFGKSELTREQYRTLPISSDGMDRIIDEKYMHAINTIGINNSHVFFFYNFSAKGYLTIYNRARKEVFSIALKQIEDDLFSGGVYIREISNTYQEHFIGIIEPSRINIQKPFSPEFVKIEFKADDNPAIILYDFIL